MKIQYNQPYLTGKEAHYIYQAVYSHKKLSGNGYFTKKCHSFFEKKYGFKKVLLTTSCTAALEMSALLADIQPGDEVILPSYTFASTANAFALFGAKLVFADSCSSSPNIDVNKIEDLVTEKTKVIVVIHYAGVSCDMDKVMSIARQHKLLVIEDAAHAIDATYKNKSLGSIGHLATFSFHETKNIISGEGGMLVVNDPKFLKRAEIIWEKGTNRAAFARGEVKKYEWIDLGSSYLPSELIAAFLFAQRENLDDIQKKRVKIWKYYYKKLAPLAKKGLFKLPKIPRHASNNGHIFYLLCSSKKERSQLIKYLNSQGILAIFHYLSLHSSPYYTSKHPTSRSLLMSDYYTHHLVRLPLFYDLTTEEQDYICNKIKKFYEK